MDIAAAYNKHKNLKLAADELGVKWQTLYVQLRKLNIPVTGDKLKYGSNRDRLAARAEIEFQRLVPFAINQNKVKFQSKFDYFVGNEKVDIKASHLKPGNKRFKQVRWAFSVKRQELCADFIVCFGMLDNGYKLFLIPGECVRYYQTISISNTGVSKWHQYAISPEDLTIFFKDLISDDDITK